MKTTSKMRCLRYALVGVIVSWPLAARATPEFPGVVEQTLGLSKITIDAPQGCTLCHTTDAGGTSLRTFGLLLQQYGAQPYDDGSLEGALAAVAQSEPQLIDDIKAGSDPNDDPDASSRPTPGYGCGVGRVAPRGSAAWALAFAALSGIGWRRRRFRTARTGTRPRLR